MHTAELPMMVFTIAAQMSVGAFVVLGIIQLVARRHGDTAVDKVTDPVLYAIGPVMVFGLIASVFHMNDFTNTLNVVRHVADSWLSREIVFGVGFAGLGFLFAVAQWFKWGSSKVRQALALLTAVVGLGLVTSMSMIYYTLVTVPAWNTWATPAQFFTTTFLLGSLAVGAALMGSLWWASRRGSTDVADLTTPTLVAVALRGTGVASVVLLGVQFLVIPLHIADLAGGDASAQASVAAYSGAWFVARLLLVFLGAGLLGVLTVRYASIKANPRILGILATTAFALVLVGELIGRSQFYEQMVRIGV